MELSKALDRRMARDLLMVDIFDRMCWRWVVSAGLSRVYMYKFLAVLESCTYMRGYAAGSVSIPMFIANVSAVLMLVSDAPIAFGTYVTLARIGIILELSQVVEGGSAVSAASSMHSTAEAVMIG